MNQELCLVICFFVGVLVFYLLKQNCGCDTVVEGLADPPCEGTRVRKCRIYGIAGGERRTESQCEGKYVVGSDNLVYDCSWSRSDGKKICQRDTIDSVCTPDLQIDTESPTNPTESRSDETVEPEVGCCG